MKVWVVVLDAGLNGSSVEAVYAHAPVQEEIDQLVPEQKPTGYSGLEVVEMEVLD